MSCCEQHDDHCGSQLAADCCCGGGEQAQQPTLQSAGAAVAGTSVTLLPRVWTAGSSELIFVLSSDLQRPVDALTHVPPHLLQTVLFI
jgi:hypothetical protein